MPHPCLVLSALLALLAAVSAAAAQGEPAIASSLELHTGIFDDVALHIQGGTAVLSGRVVSADTKNDLGRRARRMPGVTAVRNDIVVLPHSAADEELRYRIARAIYGHPAFWNHAARPNPPVRILVESGNVTLCGTVESASERALARALATGQGERTVTSRIRLRGDGAGP
jgi:osmotically-inducible protein OsmY